MKKIKAQEEAVFNEFLLLVREENIERVLDEKELVFINESLNVTEELRGLLRKEMKDMRTGKRTSPGTTLDRI